MDISMSRRFLIRSLLQIVFVSCPAIIMSGYLVYRFRPVIAEWTGFPVGDFAYSMILLFVMWGAMWLTTHKILREIFHGRNKSTNESA